MTTLFTPAPKERQIAATMHLATIFFPIVAPVVGLMVGRKLPFLSAHAKRSLQETLLLQGVVLIGATCSLIYGLVSLWNHYQTDWKDFSIWPIIARFIIGYLILLLLEFINAISAIRNAQKAYKGVWPGRSRHEPKVLA